MARRVFFHIGAPKTGTTFLQQVLWANRETLAAQGVLFAGERYADRVHATNVVRQTRELPQEWQRTSWRRIVAQVAAFDGDAVISHEFFAAADAEQAERALADLAPAEVHLVYTARDLSRVVPALWQEELKFRSATRLADYEPAPLSAGPRGHFGWRTIDPVDALRRWGSGLPPDRVHVVTVPPEGAPPDELWRRFATVCGIDPASVDLDVASPNQSLGVVQAELLRRAVSRLDPDIRTPNEVARWVRDFLGHEVLVPLGGSRIGLTPTGTEQLRARSLQIIADLAAAGYDVAGDLADLLPPEAPLPTTQPEDVDDSELLDAALDAIARMVTLQRDTVRERDRWRRQAEDVQTERDARSATPWASADRLAALLPKVWARFRRAVAR